MYKSIKIVQTKVSLEHPVTSLLQMPQPTDVSRTNVGIHTSLSTQKVHECLALFQRGRQVPAFGDREPHVQPNSMTAEAVGLVELGGCDTGPVSHRSDRICACSFFQQPPDVLS